MFDGKTTYDVKMYGACDQTYENHDPTLGRGRLAVSAAWFGGGSQLDLRGTRFAQREWSSEVNPYTSERLRWRDPGSRQLPHELVGSYFPVADANRTFLANKSSYGLPEIQDPISLPQKCNAGLRASVHSSVYVCVSNDELH